MRLLLPVVLVAGLASPARAVTVVTGVYAGTATVSCGTSSAPFVTTTCDIEFDSFACTAVVSTGASTSCSVGSNTMRVFGAAVSGRSYGAGAASSCVMTSAVPPYVPGTVTIRTPDVGVASAQVQIVFASGVGQFAGVRDTGSRVVTVAGTLASAVPCADTAILAYVAGTFQIEQ